MRSRAQTETLGFVLVFAIITASIGLVYASGFTGLNEVREFEQTNNAERAFEVLADNLEDITHRNAPSRSTEIKLASAQLRIAEPIEIEFNDSDAGFNATYEVRPVVYDAGTGTSIVYVQGAVMRQQADGAVVTKEATLILDQNHTIIPIVQTRLVGTQTVSGTTTVLLRADHSQTRLVYVNDSAASNQVWLNMTTPRATAWRDHLESTYDDATCQVSGDTVSCSVTTDRVYVTVVQIDLGIE